MTNKEFEAKKQEIIQFMNKSLVLVPTHQANTYIISDSKASELENKLKQLQPPKPPTCATCKSLNGKAMSYCQNYRTDQVIGRAEIADEYIEILNINDFGCIHHSDYEAAK